MDNEQKNVIEFTGQGNYVALLSDLKECLDPIHLANFGCVTFSRKNADTLPRRINNHIPSSTFFRRQPITEMNPTYLNFNVGFRSDDHTKDYAKNQLDFFNAMRERLVLAKQGESISRPAHRKKAMKRLETVTKYREVGVQAKFGDRITAYVSRPPIDPFIFAISGVMATNNLTLEFGRTGEGRISDLIRSVVQEVIESRGFVTKDLPQYL